MSQFLEDAKLAEFFGHNGRFPWEGKASHSLWLSPGALDALQAAVPAAYPGRLTERRKYDVSSPHAAQGVYLWADVTRIDDFLQLCIESHDAGFVHEVAARVAAAGHAGLVVDEEQLWSEPLAPYLALTEHLPGATPRTILLDPVREAPRDLEVMRDWLARYTGAEPSEEGWGLGRRLGEPKRWERLGMWMLEEGGVLLPAPYFKPEGTR